MCITAQSRKKQLRTKLCVYFIWIMNAPRMVISCTTVLFSNNYAEVSQPGAQNSLSAFLHASIAPTHLSKLVAIVWLHCWSYSKVKQEACMQDWHWPHDFVCVWHACLWSVIVMGLYTNSVLLTHIHAELRLTHKLFVFSIRICYQSLHMHTQHSLHEPWMDGSSFCSLYNNFLYSYTVL